MADSINSNSEFMESVVLYLKRNETKITREIEMSAKTKKVKAERIIIKNLFNKFNYDFNLNNGYDISVLIGPNGCGKTTIFNIIDFLFHPIYHTYVKFKDIPFDNFECILSDGTTFKLIRNKTVDKKTTSQNEKNVSLELYYQIGTRKNNSFIINDNTTSFFSLFDNHKNIIESNFDYYELRSYIREKFRSYRTFDEYRERIRSYRTFDEYKVKAYYENLLEMDRYTFEQIYNTSKSFYKKNKEKFNLLSVNYITSNRLFAVKDNNEYAEYIQNVNEDIKTKYEKANDEYKSRQSWAKDEILNNMLNLKNLQYRFLFDINRKELNYLLKDLNNEWTSYINNITDCYKYNLLDESEGQEKVYSGIIDNISEYELLNHAMYHNNDACSIAKFIFMAEYIKVFKGTIEPMKSFRDKLNVFLTILNERNKITGKLFSFSKEKGFVLCENKEELPLEGMSSGEKNDFVMFYKLLFNSEENGLVLIDEPEISEHIDWQELFLDKMLEICEKNNLHAIIATHSPHILNGREELLIDGGLVRE